MDWIAEYNADHRPGMKPVLDEMTNPGELYRCLGCRHYRKYIPLSRVQHNLLHKDKTNQKYGYPFLSQSTWVFCSPQCRMKYTLCWIVIYGVWSLWIVDLYNTIRFVWEGGYFVATWCWN